MTSYARDREPTDRVGLALVLMAGIGGLLCAWVAIAFGRTYLGPLPTISLCVVPGLAASWVWAWPRRHSAATRFRIVVAVTVIIVAILAVISVLHAQGAT